jgi:hypothetical protein
MTRPACRSCGVALTPPCRYCTSCGKSHRSWWRITGWVVSVFFFACAAWATVEALTFPKALAHHPVSATATVTDQFIDGFGGDPNVDYRYTVNGRTYTGYGTAALGPKPALDLNPGDDVIIVYARDEPGASCTCDPSDVANPAYPAMDAVFATPLVAMTFFAVRRRRRLRRDRRPPAGTEPPKLA